MLSLFRVNDPLRIGLAILLLVAVRAFWLGQGLPNLPIETYGLAIGEKMATGGHMYRDVWDNTAPISAGLYWLAVELGGKSALNLRVLALLLVAFQAALWALSLFRHQVYAEKNYVPAILYVLIALSTNEFLTLSPTLIGLTFVILALDSVFSMRNQPPDKPMFMTGLYLGLALACDMGLLPLLLLLLLGVPLVRTVDGRRFLLSLYGASMPLIMVAAYCVWHGYANDFWQNLVLGSPPSAALAQPDFSVALLALVPAVLLLGGLLIATKEGSFINFQLSCQRLVLIYVACAVLCSFWPSQLAGQRLVLALLPASFYGAYLFTLLKKRLWAELGFLLLLCWCLGQSYWQYSQTAAPAAHSEAAPTSLKGKKILVLGHAPQWYAANQLATPYLNWKLAQRHFANLDYYSTLVVVYQHFAADPPEVIIDEAGFAATLFDTLLPLGRRYRPSPQQPKHYFLVSP